MKECWSEGDLRAYLDRELPPEDMERVAEHLEVCSECGDHWAELAGRAARVSALMEGLADNGPAASIARIPRKPRRATWIWAGAAAALAAGLMLGLFSVPKHQMPVAQVQTPMPAVRAVPDRTDPIEDSTPHAVSAVARPGRPRAGQATHGPSRREIRTSDDFVSLDDEPISTGVVLRVELGPKGIPADVIFGPEDRKSTRLNYSHVEISY